MCCLRPTAAVRPDIGPAAQLHAAPILDPPTPVGTMTHSAFLTEWACAHPYRSNAERLRALGPLPQRGAAPHRDRRATAHGRPVNKVRVSYSQLDQRYSLPSPRPEEVLVDLFPAVYDGAHIERLRLRRQVVHGSA